MSELTADGYPTPAGIRELRKARIGSDWPINRQSVYAYIDLIKSMWHYESFKSRKRHGVFFFELHTLGWSGNEEIIHHVRQSFFWMFYWEKSLRGGHYYFQIPDATWRKK